MLKRGNFIFIHVTKENQSCVKILEEVTILLAELPQNGNPPCFIDLNYNYPGILQHAANIHGRIFDKKLLIHYMIGNLLLCQLESLHPYKKCFLSFVPRHFMVLYYRFWTLDNSKKAGQI